MNEYEFDNLTHETCRLQEELQYLISPKVTGKGGSQIILDMFLFLKIYIYIATVPVVTSSFPIS